MGCSAFARRYWRNHSCFLFLQVLRWFTSLRCLPPAYVFSRGYLDMTRGGLPHSDIFGSKLVCSSPKLFAACHVLHRLLAPRHSPYTLSSLTIRNSKLTRTHRLHVDGSCDSSMQHCSSTFALASDGGQMLWSEKTTVCRIFNCQRSAGGHAPTPPARSLAGPCAPLRSLAGNIC